MCSDDIPEGPASGWSSTDSPSGDIHVTGSPRPEPAPSFYPAPPPASEPITAEGTAAVAAAQEQAGQDSLFAADAPVVVPEPAELAASFGVPDRDVPNAPVDVTAFVAPSARDDVTAPEPEVTEPPLAEAAAPDAALSDDLAAVRADLDADVGAPVMPLALEDEPLPAEETVLSEETAADGDEQPAEEAAPGAADPTEEDMAAAAAAAAAFAAAAEAAQEDAVTAVLESGAPEGADNDADAVEALLEAEAEQPVLVAVPEAPDRMLSVPFYVYVGVWFVFSVAMVLVLQGAASAGTLDSAAEYPMFVLGGLVLTVIGPVLALFIWALRRFRPSDGGERPGLFATVLLRGALATFAGVAMWYVAIVVLNYLKTGRII